MVGGDHGHTTAERHRRRPRRSGINQNGCPLSAGTGVRWMPQLLQFTAHNAGYVN